VRLVCEGSHILPHIKHLEEKGVTIFACGTCLNFFNLADKQKVGKPTTMVDSLKTMLDSTIVSL
jgi:intracellular sulfur oxidation DsrE/DsrF family protein